jgi:PhnB protein
MTEAVDPIPRDYPRVCAYLHVDGASAAIEFYREVFGATERMRLAGPDGKVGHAELAIGDSVVMLADEYPDMGIKGPLTLGGSPVGLTIYVEDVDATVGRATAAGAAVTRPVEDQFYGDRAGQIEDPYGHTWSIHTHIEDVAPDEMARRAADQVGAG